MAVSSLDGVLLIADLASELTGSVGYETQSAYAKDTTIIYLKVGGAWVPKAATLGVGSPTLVGGHVPVSQLGAGTPNASKFLRGDGAWEVPPGGGGYSGTTTVNFGGYPGLTYTTTFVPLEVEGPTIVNAWITPIATPSHSVDEHLVEEVSVHATFEDGVGITIYGTAPGSPLTGEFSVAWTLE